MWSILSNRPLISKLKNPVIFPTPLPRCTHSIQSRLSGAPSKGFSGLKTKGRLENHLCSIWFALPVARDGRAGRTVRLKRRNGAEILVDGEEFMIGHIAIVRPRHHLKQRRPGLTCLMIEVLTVSYYLKKLLPGSSRRQSILIRSNV